MLEIIASFVLLACLLMACVPTLPGIPLMFVVTFVYALFNRFETIHPSHLIAFALLTALSIGIDTFSGILGAKFGGASRKSLLAGMIGLFVGLVAFPPLGAFIGLFVGVLGAEIIQFGDHAKALKAATSSMLSALAGTAINIVLAVVYFVAFFVIVF